MAEATAARTQTDPDPTITINSDGSHSAAVTINPGGVVKFDVTFPTGMNTCTIPFSAITFSNEARPTDTGSGTVKVGS